MDNAKATEIVSPKGDSRLRVSRSEKLWIINRVWSEDKACVIGYVAFESIERSVYCLFAREGEWVRYQNSYYPLHKPQELEHILASSKRLDYGFHNNAIHHARPAFAHTEPAHFIFTDESGPIAW